jgi:DNA modification methylase
MTDSETKDLMLFQHPILPDEWNYDESVTKMKRLIYKWTNLTRDVANELWIARENLSAQGKRTDLDANASKLTWSSYCKEIGLDYTTANRWLNRWFPESLDLENKPLVYEADYKEWLEDQSQCDLLLTDPPYMTDVEDIFEFAKWLPYGLAKVKPTGRAYVCIGAYPEEISAYLQNHQASDKVLANILIWTYQNTLGPSPTHHYKLNYQAILYFCGVDAPPLKCPSMVEQFTVQNIPAPDGRQGDRYHTWQKPLELADRLIKHSTDEDDTILDPFVGTGTFALAANRLGRVGKGCDIDPIALDIAVKRGCKLEQ